MQSDIANNHTLIDIKRPANFMPLTLSDKFAAVGSCFTDEMSRRLRRDGIDVCRNPFGTIYNPQSILDCLHHNLSEQQFTISDILTDGRIFFTPYHSTLFDSDNANELLNKSNKSLAKSAEKIKNANVFLITYGSAVVYEYENHLMANCHKVPQEHFIRRMMTSDEIADVTEQIIRVIRQYRADAGIIFTISPVRHKHPDLLTNSTSKAMLKVGLSDAISAADNNTCYFPSFEIVIDQLRDYAHYRDDGVHLTDLAADYIYDIFLNVFFNQNDIADIKHIRRMRAILNHKTSEHNQAYYDNMVKVQQELDVILTKHPTKRLKKLYKKASKSRG